MRWSEIFKIFWPSMLLLVINVGVIILGVKLNNVVLILLSLPLAIIGTAHTEFAARNRNNNV